MVEVVEFVTVEVEFITGMEVLVVLVTGGIVVVVVFLVIVAVVMRIIIIKVRNMIQI